MSEKRKCVNCRHNICKEKPSGNIECVCEITNSHIGYVKCLEGWCRHWAKDKKLFVCPDQNEELEAKAVDIEDTELAKSFEQELRKHNQDRYNKWQDLVKIEEVDYKNFEWGYDKTYVKEPFRSSGEVKGTINAKFEEIFKPKCFVANDEIEKEHQAYIDLISDTTFAFIEEAYMKLLHTAKNVHCVGENDRIYYEWDYETLEENVPLPHDNRPCYEKGRVTLRYTIVRAENKEEIFDRNFRKLTSGIGEVTSRTSLRTI